MIGLFFTDERVTDFEKAKTADLDLFARYFRGMLAEGISIAPSQFEGMFLSTAHTDADIEKNNSGSGSRFLNLIIAVRHVASATCLFSFPRIFRSPQT